MRRTLGSLLLPVIALAALGCADESTAGPAGAVEDYVPDAAIAYDGRYLDGSFEGDQGTGWDTCHTRTPGALSHEAGGGAEGSAFIEFESAACKAPCAATNPSASQIYTWFSTAPSATAKMGLYFDAKNLGSGAPTGVLRFYGTDLVCQQDSVLAEIELAKLRLQAGWSTRCVTVTGPGADSAVGLSVSGGTYAVGVDALRLGAPCHAGS